VEFSHFGVLGITGVLGVCAVPSVGRVVLSHCERKEGMNQTERREQRCGTVLAFAAIRQQVLTSCFMAAGKHFPQAQPGLQEFPQERKRRVAHGETHRAGREETERRGTPADQCCARAALPAEEERVRARVASSPGADGASRVASSRGQTYTGIVSL
jgi:hypothetical protein